MAEDKLAFLREEMANLQESKLFVHIRTIESPADAWMMVDGRKVLNFCTNNYLGLANHPKIKEAARKAISEWGVGPAAVRTIAG
ncbi:MAG: 8-amino-7-oxononanoate synthase, partial [Candidatus Latescibacteria bacterium]|nr:8-amino-7-oxononanoate synthase [Candidatus Latescibacterota bacterium]